MNRKQTLKGIAALKTNFRSDLVSGFLVFLIALPLCLGIAKASGFPPISGIYTAVIGGLIVTFFTNSQLTIKGPAAGLIVIALGAVTELGHGDYVKGYQLALAVIAISGIVQIVMGLFRLGNYGDFFPASVIHGMLAAIGVIIMAKQVHVAMGVVPTGKTPFELIGEIPKSFISMNPEVALIGLVSLLILFLVPKINHKLFKKLPGPLLVLVVAVPMGMFFNLGHEHDYEIGSLHFHINPSQLLVALPDQFFSGITFPNFSQIFSYTSIKYIIMFSLVGSIESLLSAKAIDSIDPLKRKSDLNRDLVAVGIGNTIAGFVGAIPMISEIVRSSANINNGAKSKFSNFYHGLFLFLFAMLAVSFIQQIPNAALAAMLIYTGFKLASPSEFIKIRKIGFDQLFFFLITLVVTLFTDLLVGVGVGILCKILLHIINGANFTKMFKLDVDLNISEDGNNTVIVIKNPAVFTNYLKLKDILSKISIDKNVTLDFSKAPLVDHTFLDNLYLLQDEYTRNGGSLKLVGFDKHHHFSPHPFSARRHIINPSIPVSSQFMDKRQEALYKLAAQLGMGFETKMTHSFMKFHFGSFRIGQIAKYAHNILVGNRKKFSLCVADIRFDSFDTLSKERQTATVALISFETKRLVPEFHLERKDVFSLLEDLKGKNNVHLKGHDEFSKIYYLSSENEEGISNFFTEPLIQLLEVNTKYAIESKNGQVMLHAYYEKLDPVELLDLVTFCDKLVACISED